MIIQKAQRERTFTLTSISGPSGSGKSYSALLMARGIVGPGGKVGFIDTENKRSRFYADVAGGFDVIDLEPPFTPARYIEAIREFSDAGYKVIVVDSISHEWEGTGGILEQAEAIERETRKEGLHCWNRPKKAHKKLVNTLLQTQAHLIFCCRVKEKVRQIRNSQTGRSEIVNDGWVPIAEKGFIYEMTVSILIKDETHVPTILKAPEALQPVFAQERPIDQTNGALLAKWAEEGIEIDPAFTALKSEAMEKANLGLKAMTEWWSAIGSTNQRMLQPIQKTLKSVAAARDDMDAILKEASAADFRHRMENGQGSPQGDEGFDSSRVAAEIETLSGGPESGQDGQPDDEATTKPLTLADVLMPDAGAKMAAVMQKANEAMAADRFADWTEDDKAKVKAQCRDAFLALAMADKVDAKAKVQNIEGAAAGWLPEMEFAPDFVPRMVTWSKLLADPPSAAVAKDALKVLKDAA